MSKHKLFILSFALILVVGVISLSFINVPSAYAQSGDADGDGVADGVDKCKNQFGSPSFDGCPPDGDNDGIPYTDDKCPKQAGPPSNGGCPEGSGNNSGGSNSNEPPPPDSDGDGTADPSDRCPDMPGDGANYGCPEGYDFNQADSGSSSAPQQPAINLIAMPTDGECVVSPKGTSNVNIRAYPLAGAPIVGTLEVNEFAEVLAILYDATVRAENEHATNQLGPMFLPPQPDPDDDYPTWVLIKDTNTDVIGWVAEAVVRFGGDCSDFERPEGTDPYLAIKLKPALITSYQTGNCDGDGIDPIEILTWSLGETSRFTLIELIRPRDGGCPEERMEVSLNFEPIKVNYVENDSKSKMSLNLGLVENLPTVTPNDDGTTTVEYCIYQEVHEAGVFEEVCYQIEIPEGCELVSEEAGVYKIICDDDEITLNPALQGMDMLSSPDFENIVFPKTNDDGTTTVEYCIYQEVHEAGVFEKVCYQIEVPEGCELVSSEAGVYTLDCEGDDVVINPNLLGINMLASPKIEEPTVKQNDDGTTTVEYCVYQEVHEAGVFEEVCYEIEIPEGCELVSEEAGVYKVICDDDEITLNPALQGMGMLSSPDFEPPVLPTVKQNDNGTTTVEYCIYQEVHEAGVFEEVCYQIEVPEGCELVSAEAGVYTLDCEGDDVVVNPALNGMDMFQNPTKPEPTPHTVNNNADGTTSVEYCVYLEVKEAGVFEEVCYEIEIPENCTLVSSEAGVYDIECEGEAEISLNPALEGMPAGTIVAPENPDDAILIGLLLPAVQK